MSIDQILKNVLKKINYKKILFDIYLESVSPVLDDLVKSSDAKWDDNLKAAFDLIIHRLVKP